MSLFVPYEPSEDAVRDMARQLRQMTGFVEDCTGVRVEEDALRAALARSWHAALDFRRFLMRRQGGDCPPI